MLKFKLTNNQFTYIDSSDFRRLNKYKWYAIFDKKMKSYYAVGKVNGKLIKLHRFIMRVYTNNNLVIDHKNKNTLDNRKKNLKICTQQENLKNKKIQKNNSSGFCGVYFNKRCNKWQSYIRVSNKRIHLGCFDNREEAISARSQANKKYSFSKNHGLIY